MDMKISNIWIIRKDLGICLVDAQVSEPPPEVKLHVKLITGY